MLRVDGAGFSGRDLSCPASMRNQHSYVPHAALTRADCLRRIDDQEAQSASRVEGGVGRAPAPLKASAWIRCRRSSL